MLDSWWWISYQLYWRGIGQILGLNSWEMWALYKFFWEWEWEAERRAPLDRRTSAACRNGGHNFDLFYTPPIFLALYCNALQFTLTDWTILMWNTLPLHRAVLLCSNKMCHCCCWVWVVHHPSQLAFGFLFVCISICLLYLHVSIQIQNT